MTVEEWKAVVDEIESMWGKSGKWTKADAAYRHARPIPYDAARMAVEQLFLRGAATAPSPAEVITNARSFMDAPLTRDEISRFCDIHGHQYGIVEEADGVRTGICGKCRARVELASHLLTTKTEREDDVFGATVEAIAEEVAP